MTPIINRLDDRKITYFLKIMEDLQSEVCHDDNSVP